MKSTRTIKLNPDSLCYISKDGSKIVILGAQLFIKYWNEQHYSRFRSIGYRHNANLYMITVNDLVKKTYQEMRIYKDKIVYRKRTFWPDTVPDSITVNVMPKIIFPRYCLYNPDTKQVIVVTSLRYRDRPSSFRLYITKPGIDKHALKFNLKPIDIIVIKKYINNQNKYGITTKQQDFLEIKTIPHNNNWDRWNETELAYFSSQYTKSLKLQANGNLILSLKMKEM